MIFAGLPPNKHIQEIVIIDRKKIKTFPSYIYSKESHSTDLFIDSFKILIIVSHRCSLHVQCTAHAMNKSIVFFPSNWNMP